MRIGLVMDFDMNPEPPLLTTVPPQIVYIVQRLYWQFNDVTYTIHGEKPLKVFTHRSTAEQYRKRMEIEARSDTREPGAIDGTEYLPRDDQEFTHDFFEVVEMELA